MVAIYRTTLRFFWLIVLMGGMGIIMSYRILPRAHGAQQNPRENWQGERPFRPDLQAKMSAQSDRWLVLLTTWEHPCPDALSNECFFFEIQNKLTHDKLTFRLANQTAQVDALNIVNASRLAILGRPLPNLSIVTIIDLPSGKEVDHFVGESPALSEHKWFVAYLKFVPAHPGYEWSPSAEYLVYDLTISPEYNRTPSNRASSPWWKWLTFGTASGVFGFVVLRWTSRGASGFGFGRAEGNPCGV